MAPSLFPATQLPLMGAEGSKCCTGRLPLLGAHGPAAQEEALHGADIKSSRCPCPAPRICECVALPGHGDSGYSGIKADKRDKRPMFGREGVLSEQIPCNLEGPCREAGDRRVPTAEGRPYWLEDGGRGREPRNAGTSGTEGQGHPSFPREIPCPHLDLAHFRCLNVRAVRW